MKLPEAPIDHCWKPVGSTATFRNTDHLVKWGIGVGYVLFLIWAIMLHFAGFPMDEAFDSVWEMLAFFACFIPLHELTHILFANWRQTKFRLAPKHFAVGVELGGAFSRWRLLLCTLLPAFAITAIGGWAGLALHSGALLWTAGFNLAASGVDLCTAWMLFRDTPRGAILAYDDKDTHTLVRMPNGAQLATQ